MPDRTPGGQLRRKPLRIHDPYGSPGRWVKGQLHVHTTRSDGRLTPQEVLQAYRELGFRFVCLTDHDRLNAPAAIVNGLLVPSGEESTVARPFPPLGLHLLRLFVTRPPGGRQTLEERLQATVEDEGLAAACHPAWSGNLGTGRWRVEELLDPRLRLLEIVNHHSPLEESLRLWDLALSRRGPRNALWGVAVDDSHRPEDIGQAWIWVKLPPWPGDPGDLWEGYPSAEAACLALRDAIARGAFYASTGVMAEFSVASGNGEEHQPPAVVVHTAKEARIRFYGPGPQLLSEHPGPAASYRPRASDRFVRVEVEGASGRTAWSQPFWIVGGHDVEPDCDPPR